MTDDRFESTFDVDVNRDAAWRRLAAEARGDEELWLPGFDSRVRIVASQPPDRLDATKLDEPCAGTDIVVVLEDAEHGTRIRVTQSGFGGPLPGGRDWMAIGWRFIVADLQTFLATGAHAGRHLRPWGDLGAGARAEHGGIHVVDVRPGGLASRLGLADGDLLVVLAGAPVATLDDLSTALRVLGPTATPSAEWVRDGSLLSSPAAHP